MHVKQPKKQTLWHLHHIRDAMGIITKPEHTSGPLAVAASLALVLRSASGALKVTYHTVLPSANTDRRELKPV